MTQHIPVVGQLDSRATVDSAYPSCLLLSSEEKCSGGQLTASLMVNFAQLCATLKKHNESDTHLRVMTRHPHSKVVMTGEQLDVHQQMQDENRALVAENVENLKSIISSIELCGRQNNAFS